MEIVLSPLQALGGPCRHGRQVAPPFGPPLLTVWAQASQNAFFIPIPTGSSSFLCNCIKPSGWGSGQAGSMIRVSLPRQSAPWHGSLWTGPAPKPGSGCGVPWRQAGAKVRSQNCVLDLPDPPGRETCPALQGRRRELRPESWAEPPFLADTCLLGLQAPHSDRNCGIMT